MTLQLMITRREIYPLNLKDSCLFVSYLALVVLSQSHTRHFSRPYKLERSSHYTNLELFGKQQLEPAKKITFGMKLNQNRRIRVI